MDLVCYEDVDLFAAETSDEWEILEQDLYHRLIEEPGSNPDDPDRGVGISNLLSGVVRPELFARLIEADFLKDDRVASCKATIAPRDSAGAYDIEIVVGVNEERLTMSVTADSEGVRLS